MPVFSLSGATAVRHAARTAARAAAVGGALLLVLLAGAGTRVACAQGAAPRITAVIPSPVVGSNAWQRLTIHGRGFTEGFTVRLRAKNVNAHINDRWRLDFVSSREVKVRAVFGSEALPWRVQVLAPRGASSNVYRFRTVAPAPQIEWMEPVEKMEQGGDFQIIVHGAALATYSKLRWNGKALPTTPLTSSDKPNALTVGLRAEVPAGRLDAQTHNRITVYTPPPGGGVSQPEFLTVLHRPFYRTTWFYLLLLAGLAGLGLAMHRWRLKNLRQRQLERRVQQRTTQLRQEKEKTEHQAERLLELDRAKNRLFANVSHELRTPLTMIAAPVRDLLDRRDGALPPEARTTLEGALHNAERLKHQVDQILDLSRLEASRLSLERRPGDLVGFAREVVRAFLPMAERRGLSLRFRSGEEHLALAFDPARLRTVLDNLLSNALKFTPEGGKVLVRVARDCQEGGKKVGREEHAEIRVADTGPGIPADELPHVFDRFRQVDDSATRRHEGVGIGLSLAKELVELHGGTLRAESEPGLGATFILTLPLPDVLPALGTARGDGAQRRPEEDCAPRAVSGPPRHAAAAQSDGTEAAEATAPLLVVEDNAELRAFLRKRLSPTYRVEVARDGAEALAKARAERPALVLSDVMMPQMDGAELCRRLKDNDDLSDVPVILLTARAGEEAQVEGLDAGADAYVEKPFSMKALRVRIENLIEGRRALHERYAGKVVMEPSGVTVTSEQEAFYEQACAVVEAHIGDRAFDVGLFADAMGASVQSKSQLRRRLKDATGLTPSAFVRRMRLEYAAQLIEADGTMRVYEVAGAVGYRDAGHFSKLFRAHHGVPPSQYPPPSGEGEGDADGASGEEA